MRKLSAALSILNLILLSTPRLDAQRIVPPEKVQPPGQEAAVIQIEHIIWVWFENRDASAITAATAPYFTSFAAANVNLTSYYSVSHPSQPNYLAGLSGSTQGVTDDGHYTFPAATDNLAKQLAAAGKSWRLYAQDFPGTCFDGDSIAGGIDGPGVAGTYVRKHNPAISFESVRLDPTQCANIQPLANFDPTVNFAWIVPNLTNDMHDGTTAQGDAFLQAFVPLVMASPDWAHTLLIVTFDEATTPGDGGGHIYTAAAAPWLAHANVATTYNHFSMLRTIEQVFGLPFLGNAATATTITEVLPTQAQALNLSTRLLAQTGSNVGIGGFIISGTDPKQILVRGIGPSLASGGIPNPLANPALELHGPAGFTTINNNNWRDTQEADIQATGIAPTNDLESAILATLNPGAYTAILSDQNGGSGVGLVELYDLSRASASKLANISTRAFVSTGTDIVIGGFILGNGGGNDTIVARGLGPSLAGGGVPNPLSDPKLELRDSNGSVVISDDNWQDDPTQAAKLIGFGLAPTNALESGLASTLSPGSYTTLLSGVNNATGVGLVEVYDNPGGGPYSNKTNPTK